MKRLRIHSNRKSVVFLIVYANDCAFQPNTTPSYTLHHFFSRLFAWFPKEFRKLKLENKIYVKTFYLFYFFEIIKTYKLCIRKFQNVSEFETLFQLSLFSAVNGRARFEFSFELETWIKLRMIIPWTVCGFYLFLR